MNKLAYLGCALGSILGLAGCANLNEISKQQATIPFKAFPEGNNPAAIYLWPPYTSAAIVDKQGNRCVLAASGAKSSDISTEGALKVSQVLDKLNGLDVSTKNHLIEQFAKISQADSRAAAIDIALFHLCLLDQNGTFHNYGKPGNKSEAILDAYRFTVEKALSMAPFASQNKDDESKKKDGTGEVKSTP